MAVTACRHAEGMAHYRFLAVAERPLDGRTRPGTTVRRGATLETRILAPFQASLRDADVANHAVRGLKPTATVSESLRDCKKRRISPAAAVPAGHRSGFLAQAAIFFGAETWRRFGRAPPFSTAGSASVGPAVFAAQVCGARPRRRYAAGARGPPARFCAEFVTASPLLSRPVCSLSKAARRAARLP